MLGFFTALFDSLTELSKALSYFTSLSESGFERLLPLEHFEDLSIISSNLTTTLRLLS